MTPETIYGHDALAKIRSFRGGGNNDKKTMIELVRALARQQAKRDHEEIKKNETCRNIR